MVTLAELLAQYGGPKDPPDTVLGWVLLGVLALVVAGAITWNQWYRKR